MNLQSSHSKNDADGDLGLTIHLEVVDEEHRQYTKDPVCGTTNNGVTDRGIRNSCSIDTMAFVTEILRPEEIHRGALEKDEEEVEDAVKKDSCHGSMYNPSVCLLDGDAKEEDGD